MTLYTTEAVARYSETHCNSCGGPAIRMIWIENFCQACYARLTAPARTASKKKRLSVSKKKLNSQRGKTIRGSTYPKKRASKSAASALGLRSPGKGGSVLSLANLPPDHEGYIRARENLVCSDCDTSFHGFCDYHAPQRDWPIARVRLSHRLQIAVKEWDVAVRTQETHGVHKNKGEFDRTKKTTLYETRANRPGRPGYTESGEHWYRDVEPIVVTQCAQCGYTGCSIDDCKHDCACHEHEW